MLAKFMSFLSTHTKCCTFNDVGGEGNSPVKDLRQGLTRTLVTGRKKSGWRSYWRRWNCIPNVKVVAVRLEIVDLELFLITLSSSADARREGLKELHAADVAGRRRLELSDGLLRLRHCGT